MESDVDRPKVRFDVGELPDEPAQPILPLLLSLLTIVPSETPIEFTREPIGTGPYVLTDWTPGQSITLTRRA